MEKTDINQNLVIKDPDIATTAFIASGCQILGNVSVKDSASIWYNSVLRGDINQIVIGERSNIQDGSVLHVENDRSCIVGNDVTVGHKALLHGCTIEDGVLIGMGAIILNGAIIKKGSIIGAGAVVKENMIVDEHSLVVGIPGKVIRQLESSSYDTNVKWAAKYVQLAQFHKAKYQT